MAGCTHCPDDTDGAATTDTRYRCVLWLALAVNATMFVVEAVAGLIAGSVSLQADALDFLGDSANYAITLFVLSMGLRARAGAALLKGLSMGAFGLWVIGAATYKVVAGTPPDAAVMSATAALALVANVGVAAMLFRFRAGDSNMRSVWLCSRNDAISNVAVIAAAAGVAATASGWPDIAVAVVIAALSLSSAWQVIRLARTELVAVSPA